MTIEAKAKWYDILPLGKTELTRTDGELTLLHPDATLTAIRVISENELAVFPYVPSDEPNILKKDAPKVLVREQINEARIKGRILERSHSVSAIIEWRP